MAGAEDVSPTRPAPNIQLHEKPGAVHGDGRVFTLTNKLGDSGGSLSSREILVELENALSVEGILPVVNIIGNPSLLSSFVYEREAGLVVHLVNYNHDFDSDTSHRLGELAIEISPPEPLSAPVEVSYCTPEEPRCSHIELRYEEGRLSVRIPGVDIWGVATWNWCPRVWHRRVDWVTTWERTKLWHGVLIFARLRIRSKKPEPSKNGS